MATVSRVARITLTSGGNSRQWLATAAVQDTAAGAALSITLTQTTSGLPPDTANAVRELQVLNESGAVMATYTWAEGAASTTFTHYMTSDGLVGGTPLADTFEILLRVQKTTGGPTATYNVESDGSPNVPPILFTSTLDRGWVRSTTTVTTSVSNIIAGGGKNTPAQFADSLFARGTLGAGSSIARAITLVFTGSSKTKATSASTSTVKDVTFSGTGIDDGRVNEGFPAASSTYTCAVSTPSNSAFTGQPWTVLSPTNDSILVDPRLTAVHLFQLDDNGFGTPPYSSQNSDNERPSTSIGYIASNIRAARGTKVGNVITGGVNGLSLRESLVAQSNGDTLIRNDTTQNQGGEAGWCDDFVQWTSSLPGGPWNKTTEVTAPTDIDGPGYLINPTTTYQLIANRNPFVTMAIDVGHSDITAYPRHLHLGDELTVRTWLFNTKVGESRLLPFDEILNTPEVNIVMNTPAGVMNWTGSTFSLSGGVAGDVVWLPMTKDVDGFRWTYSTTSDQSWHDVTVTCRGQYRAVQYDTPSFREFVGNAFSHDSDQNRTLGIVHSVYEAGGTVRQRRHLCEVGDDLELTIIPRIISGVDSSVDRIQLAMRRVQNNLPTQDLSNLATGPWYDTTDVGHPNAGDLIFNDLTLLPNGAAIVRIPEAVLAFSVSTVPWFILVVRAVYNEGLPNEFVVTKDKQIEVYSAINSHSGFALDPVAFALHGVISYK